MPINAAVMPDYATMISNSMASQSPSSGINDGMLQLLMHLYGMSEDKEGGSPSFQSPGAESAPEMPGGQGVFRGGMHRVGNGMGYDAPPGSIKGPSLYANEATTHTGSPTTLDREMQYMAESNPKRFEQLKYLYGGK